ncbi:protein phosphatase 1 regulatory subunit 1B isoform X2 [Sardina pilchardus]|uniref:protein phosphatase 1 regulatory subunit 1B isoform X2 n=1 Tax=Sardina pilchardus TaxID=27697 RepID=UPI002E15824D
MDTGSRGMRNSMHIRRRRPTPATLFRVADQSSPEDDNSTHQWVVGENGVLKPKRVNPNVYQPPSLKAVQQMAEAQMQKLGVYPHMEEENEDYPGQGDEDEDTGLTESSDQQEVGPTDTGSGTVAMARSGVAEESEEEEEEEEQKREEESRKGE